MKYFLYMCILLYFLVSGCGLDEFVNLQPPEVGELSPTAHQIEFLSTEYNNENELFGFELYYKLYNTEIDATHNDSKALNKAALLSLGYKRINSDDDYEGVQSLPLIRIESSEKGKASSFTINLEDPAFIHIDAEEIDGSGGIFFTDFMLFRDMVDSETSDFKSFNGLTEGDSDLQGLDLTQNIYIAFYVLSYGLNLDDFSPIHSVPLWLDCQILIDNF